ncbi:MAG: 3-isopropylmalate dehydratase small subunit [Oscillospiraceae bacterium]|jgi:3-isopropylmalate/(R)-2-methylmalate dehydratase small subunit|nr:3-isopropylmalate dehydratase small subunit [Oscillospiraceae bacterium]
MTIRGRVWIFGDEINTDLIVPHITFRLPPEEQPKYVFSDNRPGWAQMVEKGDIIVAGKNFGTGSSRPGALLLRRLGLSGMIAASFNGLFFRNCVSYGFPALVCPGAERIFIEGDVAVADLLEGSVLNERTGEKIFGVPISASAVNIIKAGGIEELLVSEGYMELRVES